MTESATTQQPTSFKILLIGDSCIDEYKIGSVDRLSPEAPVPVIKLVETYTLPGMSANVLKNFAALGVYPDFVSNDETITKTRYLDKKSGQHLLRVDQEHSLTPWNGQTPCSLGQYKRIVISDYNKGFLTYESIEYIIRNAACPVFIDTKKTQLEDISAEWVFFKLNETEYKSARSLPSNLIVTLGDRGAEYNGVRYPTNSVEVMDVCGCGDTFLAALTIEYLYTKDIKKAILYANKAASITVQHRGNYSPTCEEISKISG
jgi:bifunctional ADP-heptose synthase (sugar kinase/adenylyltransferase)